MHHIQPSSFPINLAFLQRISCGDTQYVLVSSMSTQHMLLTGKKEKPSSPDYSVGKLWPINLIHNWYGRAQLNVGSITPGFVVLGAIKKSGWASREQVSKQCPSMASVLLSATIFLPWVPGLTSFTDRLWCGSELDLFISRLFIVMVFCHHNRNPYLILYKSHEV